MPEGRGLLLTEEEVLALTEMLRTRASELQDVTQGLSREWPSPAAAIRAASEAWLTIGVLQGLAGRLEDHLARSPERWVEGDR